MDNSVDMKRQQQQVTTLGTEQQKRTNRVAELEEEVEKITVFIQPVHQKCDKKYSHQDLQLQNTSVLNLWKI